MIDTAEAVFHFFVVLHFIQAAHLEQFSDAI